MPLLRVEREGGMTGTGFFVLELGCHVFSDLFPFSFGSGSSGGLRRAAGNGGLGSGVTAAGGWVEATAGVGRLQSGPWVGLGLCPRRRTWVACDQFMAALRRMYQQIFDGCDGASRMAAPSAAIE
jgi:hypothetical protein